jgi:hypothetical protein
MGGDNSVNSSWHHASPEDRGNVKKVVIFFFFFFFFYLSLPAVRLSASDLTFTTPLWTAQDTQ